MNELIDFRNTLIKEDLIFWEKGGSELYLQTAQVYAVISIATELQNIAHKLGGIDTEIQNLRGRMP